MKSHFKELIQAKVKEIFNEGETKIDDENHKLKIADKFRFRALDDFIIEDLARDDKEEKKIKRLRKEKKEMEEKAKIRGKGCYTSFRQRRFGEKEDFKDKTKEDFKCFNCKKVGHMARNCNKPMRKIGAQGV